MHEQEERGKGKKDDQIRGFYGGKVLSGKVHTQVKSDDEPDTGKIAKGSVKRKGEHLIPHFGEGHISRKANKIK